MSSSSCRSFKEYLTWVAGYKHYAPNGAVALCSLLFTLCASPPLREKIS
jgi:hypothetical protein